MKSFTRTQKLTISAICIALYLVVMMSTQGFAFGQYQVRIATALYGLAAIFPFTVPAFALANLLSNVIMGGLGVLDALGGAFVGLATTGLVVWAKRAGLGNWVVIPIITLVPGLVVPMWLSYLLDIPYWVLATSLLIGQSICGLASFFLVSGLEKVGVTNKEVVVKEV